MPLFLRTITGDSAFDGTTYNWRGMTVFEVDHFENVVHLSRDIWEMCAAIVLAEAGMPAHADAVAEDVPLALLARGEVMGLATIWLGQRAYRRFVFREMMRRTLRDVRLPVATRDVFATYLTPALRSPAVTESEAAALLDRFREFLDRWLPLPFMDLLMLPYRSTLAIDGAARDRYLEYVDDLLDVASLHAEKLGDDATWDVLSFWIDRTRDAGVWRDAEQQARGMALCAKEAQAMHEYGEDGGWIDYLLGWRSELTIAYLLESAPDLYFPIDRLRTEQWRADSTSWLSNDFFERGDKATFHVKDDPKGKRVLEACREYAATCDARAMLDEDDDLPIELHGHTFEEVRETHRFLTGGARKRFLGHVAEILALPLVVRYATTLFGESVTCIPGTAISYAHAPDTHGPDAIIGTVTMRDRAVIRVQAIVEVKGCERSRELLLDELRRHRRRLESETVLLSFRGRRWEPAPEPKRPSTADRQQIEVERFEFADDFLFISVVPGRPSGRDDSGAEMLQLQLPWSAAGIRAMTRGFLVATLRESANWVDRDHRDYTLGQRAWAAAVRPHLADPRLTREDRRSMLQIIDLEIAPERELLAMIAERRAMRAAARRPPLSHF